MRLRPLPLGLALGLALLALGWLPFGGTVAGPAATCRWEPRHEVWCEATGWGRGTPTWEVRDTATGELLHRTRSTAARLVLSGDRWRDVTVTTDRGQPPTLRLMWAPGRLKQLRPQ